jgi:very-short-patch-repair endonuclease
MVQTSLQSARRLRQKQTDAERLLWFRLRDRRLAGWKFKRQVPIDRFIVDFFCPDAKLIIELDGGQHDRQQAHDQKRTAVVESKGYLVVRFWNNDVIQNMDGVLEEILRTVEQLRSGPPHPNPLPPELGLARVRHSKSGQSRIYPTLVGERERT